MKPRTPLRAAVGLALPALLLAGCAAPRLDAQWTDPQAAGQSLRGSKVMVACEAYEPVVKRLCLDELSAQVTAAGAQPVLAPDAPSATPGRPVPDEQLLASARLTGARGVLSSTMTMAAGGSAPGSGVSIGIGGFGGGRHVGGGIGVTVPVGGSETVEAYTANSKLIDVSSGRLLWTAKATSPASKDVAAQVQQLSRTVFESARKSGLF